MKRQGTQFDKRTIAGWTIAIQELVGQTEGTSVFYLYVRRPILRGAASWMRCTCRGWSEWETTGGVYSAALAWLEDAGKGRETFL